MANVRTRAGSLALRPRLGVLIAITLVHLVLRRADFGLCVGVIGSATQSTTLSLGAGTSKVNPRVTSCTVTTTALPFAMRTSELSNSNAEADSKHQAGYAEYRLAGHEKNPGCAASTRLKSRGPQPRRMANALHEIGGILGPRNDPIAIVCRHAHEGQPASRWRHRSEDIDRSGHAWAGHLALRARFMDRR